MAVVLVAPFAYPLVFLVTTALRSTEAYNRSPLGFSGFPTLTHLSICLDGRQPRSRGRELSDRRTDRCRNLLYRIGIGGVLVFPPPRCIGEGAPRRVGSSHGSSRFPCTLCPSMLN